ncbi:TOBE domain-containing protein, partial [Pantoea sp.]
RQGSQPITVGVRPHDFRLDEAAPPEAVVRLVEVTGESSLLHLDWQGYPLHVQLHGRIMAQPGDKLPLAIDAEKMHLFDRESGMRLATTV